MNIDKDIEILKEFTESVFCLYGQEEIIEATKNVLKELEKKDKKLDNIENHIKAEIMMIEKTYNEVGLFAQKQYDGMRASYKCLLNVFFARNEVDK